MVVCIVCELRVCIVCVLRIPQAKTSKGLPEDAVVSWGSHMFPKENVGAANLRLLLLKLPTKFGKVYGTPFVDMSNCFLWKPPMVKKDLVFKFAAAAYVCDLWYLGEIRNYAWRTP